MSAHVEFINPYKPSYLFVGHRQTAHTQMRGRRTRQGLHCIGPFHLITVGKSFVLNGLNKLEK